MASLVADARLTIDEVARYHRAGQVTPHWRLPDDAIVRMQRALERLLAARTDVRPDFIALPHVAAEQPTVPEVAREFFDFATQPALLARVEPLIGKDIILWASAVFCKPASAGLEVPWHQDGQYWPIRPRATVTVWIAFDFVTRENGCMQFIPGSHRMGDFSHDLSEREDLVLSNVLNDQRLDLSTARTIELDPGQCSLHEVNLVHSSQPNRSGRRRAGYAIRYMPSTSHYDRTLKMGNASRLAPIEFSSRPIGLLRGTDRCGKNDFTVGHTRW